MKTLIWGIVWLVGAVWFWYYLAGDPLGELALIRRADVTDGLVVDTWEDLEDGDDGRAHWFHGATYVYWLPDGRKFTKEKSGSGRLKEEFRYLQQPYQIEVEYLADNPTVSRIKGDGSDTLADWLWRKIVLLGLFITPGIVLVRNGVLQITRLHSMESPVAKSELTTV